MSIVIHEQQRFFTLHTEQSTYQMKADEHGVLLHLYYGRRTEGEMDYLLFPADRGFSGNPYDVGKDRGYSLDTLPQEYPCSGNGDYRSPALRVQREDGVDGCDLRYVSHEIREGKYSLPGLPAVFAAEEEAQTFVVTLVDRTLGLRVELLYGILPKADIITRAVRVVNDGSGTLILKRTLSANLDFISGKYDILTFHGKHLMERIPHRSEVAHVAQCIGSRRGMSSHQQNPFLILADAQTTEQSGDCWGMQLVWSGGFFGLAEKDPYDLTRVQLGLMEEGFSWSLRPGEAFIAPEVILTFSTEGLSVLSQRYHRCFRKHLCRGWQRRKSGPGESCDTEPVAETSGRKPVLPVLLNSWETFFMDFTAADLIRLAESGRALGADLLVLDDGWFGDRNDDFRALGDWSVNEEKLGCSLGDLIRAVHDRGMGFGLWVEPEMVNENSRLFREHPEWAMAVPGRPPVRARYQLMLDFSNPEVVDSIYEQITKVLDQGRVDYLKWDCNRHIVDVFSRVNEPGTVLYKYVLGLYDFLERLLTRYPGMLIEGCSGGGGRFDAGMFYYTPQIWGSDNTDAIDRLRIQYGTSFGYPVSAAGAHISVCPNKQNGRVTPLVTRSVTAMAGTYGLELDLDELTQTEKDIIQQEIKIYREWAWLIREGDYYRLSDPVHDDTAAWCFVSEDRGTALLNVVNLATHGGRFVTYIRLAGLDEGMYTVKRIERRTQDSMPSDQIPTDPTPAGPMPANHGRETGTSSGSGKMRIAGAALMSVGFPVPIESGEYLAYQWVLIREQVPE